MTGGEQRERGLDHIALEVTELHQRITQLEALGLSVGRIGRMSADPTRRIVMMHDELSGFKIELIEGSTDQLAHIAVRTADIDATLQAGLPGFDVARAPYRLEAARAESAMMNDDRGFTVQFVRYDPDSPDL